MRKRVSCMCMQLDINVSKELICPLMRRKKTCILLAVFLICVTLFYKNLYPEASLYIPIFTVPQNFCDLSSLHLDRSDQHITTLLPNECHHGDLVYGNFCVVSLYAQRTAEEGAPVTLTTQGTVDYLHHVVVLCRRWAGPISVAVFTTPTDFSEAQQLVGALKNCDFCIRRWVSWHFFHHNVPMPSLIETEFLKNCSFIGQHKKKRRRSEGIYPINVGRNLARGRTSTPYVFAIDIELYPSIGILPKFERMLQNIYPTEGLHVWVLPVFEVHSKYRAPVTKSELKAMYARKQAISFHQYRCNICHKIPNLTQWMNSEKDSSKSEVLESLEPLKIWSTVKRSKKYNLHIWEPFFIGTRDDPEFDIRLSWEGKQNKMQVAFEMCLMDYNFHIVENAFLVHSPGINVFNASEEKFRNKHTIQNNKIISTIRKNLTKKYGQNKDC